MVNCSNEIDYYMNVAYLARALRKRGYPSELLQVLPYNRESREVQLHRLQQRQRRVKEKEQKDLVVFKCAFSHLLRHVRIRREFDALLHQLRLELGEQLLANAKFVVANKIEENLFLRCYPQSLLKMGDPSLPTQGRGEGT